MSQQLANAEGEGEETEENPPKFGTFVGFSKIAATFSFDRMLVDRTGKRMMGSFGEFD